MVSKYPYINICMCKSVIMYVCDQSPPKRLNYYRQGKFGGFLEELILIQVQDIKLKCLFGAMLLEVSKLS